MDDEDVSRSRSIASNAQEMNVVLSKRHDGVIVVRETKILNGVPRDGSRVGRFHRAHVEIKHRPLGEGIWQRIRKGGNLERDHVQKTFVS